MTFSIRQYAALLAIIVTLLVAVFAYQVKDNMEESRRLIQSSNSQQAHSELANGISVAMTMVRQSAQNLGRWEEVKQQINNPGFFAYWYSVRLKRYAFDLQSNTRALMIYDVEGRALDQFTDSILPLQIDTQGLDGFSFRIVSDSDIVYTLPVHAGANGGEIIGYLGSHIELLPLLKMLNAFEYIDRDTLRLINDEVGKQHATLTTDHFYYDLVRSQGLLNLERQMQASLLGMSVAVVIPTLMLFAVLVLIVGVPLKRIDDYINRLRTNPEAGTEQAYGGSMLQISELARVQDSLARYHTQLRNNQEQLMLTLNSIGDAVITVDSDSQVVQMNPVAEQLTGWKLADARGMHVSSVVNLPELDASSLLEAGMESGNVIHHNGDALLISRDRVEYRVLLTTSPLRDRSGEVRGTVLVLNDVTEQKTRDEQLQHSQKMDALGKLTGGIAHDFNNLLGAILGFSELLMRTLPREGKQRGYAKQIHGAGERARELTAKLLAFSRKETSRASAVDINELLYSQRQMLERTLTARIKLDFDLEQKLWPTHIDGDQLSDAILNISINAMHAMPDGGSLTVRTHNIMLRDSSVNPIGLSAGDYVELTISDTGIGMDKNTMRKVFEPFFTTKGSDGTGLGLSQVYGFVQRSGGAIRIDSEQGSGTRVCMYFPRHHAGVEQQEHHDEYIEVVQPISGHETVLVVDDEYALLELSTSMLMEVGYKVMQAASAREALRMLETASADLLLTDVIMPGMDGYQLAEEVSKRFPDMAIMMVSGYADNRNSNVSDELADTRLLQKPFTSAELIDAVREVLDARDAHTSVQPTQVYGPGLSRSNPH